MWEAGMERMARLAFNLKLGAEGAYAILWSDLVALRRCLPTT
ncbi:MAG: hypothetical protein WA107_05650 [Methanothrix sp.]